MSQASTAAAGGTVFPSVSKDRFRERASVQERAPMRMVRTIRMMRMLRVQGWYYQLGIPLLAILRARESASFARSASALVFAAVYFCWGYIFNNFFDVEEDAEPRNSFKSMRRPSALFITCASQALLVALAIRAGLIVETLAIMTLNALYSIPPFRLKRFLLPSLLANGAFFSFPYYAAARLLRGNVGTEDLRFTLFVFLLFLPLQYVHFLEHRELEGRTNGFRQRAAACLMFFGLCGATTLVGGSAAAREQMALVTAAYALLCSGIVFRFDSAQLARGAVKLASMGFGAYLALMAALG